MADESRKSPMFGVPVTVHSAKCTKGELSFQDDNARRQPRALCALYAFTKSKANFRSVLEQHLGFA